ncbi:MAG: hypothetical protein OEX12_06160 [Gammaproteobacteria bacterium]|nr:hypothetical protein [Gammaproteobacteria bacterium]
MALFGSLFIRQPKKVEKLTDIHTVYMFEEDIAILTVDLSGEDIGMVCSVGVATYGTTGLCFDGDYFPDFEIGVEVLNDRLANIKS